MGIFSVVFLFLLSLSCTKRCDKYITTSGEYITGGTNSMYIRQYSKIEGCKKGCFDNNTFTEYGSKKCEKCSVIEDKEFCEEFDTCQWTKDGKCKSASCPQRAKRLDENTEKNVEEFGKCVKDSDNFRQHCESNCETSYGDAYVTSCLGSHYGNGTYCAKAKLNCLRDCRTRWEDGYYGYTNPNPTGCHSGPNYDPTNPPLTPDNDLWNCGECVSSGSYYSCGGKLQCFQSYGYHPIPTITNRFDHNYARKVCHNIYGCLYTKSKSRCAKWAIWAFVLALVLIILSVAAVLGVLCYLLFKNKDKITA